MAESAGLVIGLVGGIVNLAVLLLDQQRNNRAKAKLLEQVKEEAEQLALSLNSLLDESVERLNDTKFHLRLRHLRDVLPDVRKALSTAKTRKDVGEVVTRLSQQVKELEPIRSIESNRVSHGTSTQVVELIDPLAELDQQKPALIPIHVPEGEHIRADIILVHALVTDARKTWTTAGRQQIFWPKDILSNDVKDCAIWVYNYDANLSGILVSETPLAEILNHHTRDLIRRVNGRATLHHSLSGKPDRPLIWIAHSLGGLIVKNALVLSEQKSEEERLSSRTLAVLFLGTPHSGSSFISRASRFTSIVALLSGTRVSRIRQDIQSVHLADSTLVSVTSAFAARLDRPPWIKVVSFFESDCSLTEQGPRLVVEPFAGLSHPNEFIEKLDGNHMTICKFEAKQERGYQRILHFIKLFTGSSGSTLLLGPDVRRDRSPSTTNTSASDAETTNINEIYSRLRLKIDRSTTRWTSSKHGKNNHGRWFIETPDFRNWLQSNQDNHSRLHLFIRGPLGCGKTMITDSMIEELRAHTFQSGAVSTTCHLHYYFNSAQSAQQAATSLLLGFVAQALDQNAALARHLVVRSQDLKANNSRSQAQLSGTLQRVLEDSCWKRVYVVVDGLDECLHEFVQSSFEVLDQMLAMPKVRMILTTSDESDIRVGGDSEPDCTALAYKMYSQLRSSGIRFKEIRLQDFESWRTAVREHITSTLALGGSAIERNGSGWAGVPEEQRQSLQQALFEVPTITFSVVDLVLQHLLLEQRQYLFTEHGEDLVHEVGKVASLTSIYQILIDLAMAAEQPTIALVCVLACAVRPLRVLEICTLLHFMKTSVPCSAATLTEMASSLEDRISRADLKILILAGGDGLQLASNLVRTVVLRQMAKADETDPLVTEQNELSERFVLPEQVHFHLAQACLRTLLCSNVQSGTRERRFSGDTWLPTPETNYARNHWQTHLREARSFESSLNDLVKEYCNQYPSARSKTSNVGTASNERLFRTLTEDNLSQSLAGIFGNSTTVNTPEIAKVEAFLNDIDYPLQRATISTIEQLTLGKIQSQPESTVRFHFRLKLEVLKNIDHKAKDTPSQPDFDSQLEKLHPSSDEVALLMRAAILAQNVPAVESILRNSRAPLALRKCRPLLQEAIRLQSAELVRRLAQYREVFDLSSSLIVAVRTANLNICSDLLTNGADVDAKNRSGSSALHLAVASGRDQIVELLLSWNASVNTPDHKGRSALHLAAESGQLSTIKVLLRNSCYQTTLDRFGRTPLFVASACGHRDVIRALWQAGAELEETDSCDRTALHAAARTGHDQTVQMLLEAGLSSSSQDRLKITPLHEAAESGWAEIVQQFLQDGTAVDKRAQGDLTPLHFACTSVNAPEDVVQLLLDKGADPNARDSLGRTPILIAAHYSTLRVFRRLWTLAESKEAHKDKYNHGIKEYLLRPILLSECQKENRSKADARSLWRIRREMQAEKMAFLGIESQPHDSSDWTIEDLRSLAQRAKDGKV